MSFRTLRLFAATALAATAFTAFSTPVMAQQGLLLPEALVAEALAQHPAVLAAEARFQAAEAQSQMLRIGPHEVELSTSAARRRIDREGSFGEYDVGLSRPFRLPGKARLDREAGALGLSAAEAGVAQARLDTAQLLRGLWIDWASAAALVANDRAMLTSLKQAQSAVDRRVALKDASALEGEQAAAAVALAEAQWAGAQTGEARAKARLQAQFPHLVLPATAPMLAVDKAAVEDIETLRQEVADKNPALARARAEAQYYGVLADRARADKTADPSLGVRLFSERGGEEKGAGLTLSLPLGGGYRARLADEAAATARAAQWDLTALDRAEMAERNASLAEAQMLITVWESTQKAVDFNASVAERTARGYALGAIDLVDVIYAQRQLQESQRAEIQARSEAVQAIVKLQINAQRLWHTPS